MSESVLGPSLIFEGEWQSQTPLRIEGKVKGNIRNSDLVSVEHGAHLEGGLHSAHARIAGILQGSIQAEQRVEITEQAQMLGDIHSPRVQIADGAKFKGTIEMD